MRNQLRAHTSFDDCTSEVAMVQVLSGKRRGDMMEHGAYAVE
jgi:hypothetical protein